MWGIRMSERLWKTFSELVGIYSPSFREREFCDTLINYLTYVSDNILVDDAGKKINGNCGNLYCYVPGSINVPPLLFSAHMDTVEPAKGKRAVLHQNGDITSAGDTILGADDIAGISVILEAVLRLKEQNIPHRPLELLFPVAEEKYGAGSAVFDYSALKSKEAYVLDLGGEVGEAANAAPTILSFEIKIHGKAAHAGFAPKSGINAIAAAARAIANLYHGEPAPGLTFNIGRITGGEADNIVPSLCTVSGEIRSLSHDTVMAYWNTVKSVFIDETSKAGANIVATYRIELKAYETPLNSVVVRRFVRACGRAGITPRIHSTFGGSDLNNFALHGITGLVIACGMHEAHSLREYSNIHELEKCVKLVMELITDREEMTYEDTSAIPANRI